MAISKITSAGVATDTLVAGDIAAGAVGSSEIAANAVGTSEIATGGVLPANIAYLGDGSGNLSGTITNQQLHFGTAFTLTDDLTINGDVTLAKVRDDGLGQSITGSGRTLTGTGTLTMGNYVEGGQTSRDDAVTSVTGLTGVMESSVTGIPAAGITGVLPVGVTGGSGLDAVSAGKVLQVRFASSSDSYSCSNTVWTNVMTTPKAVITPSNALNKIYISFSTWISPQSRDNTFYISIYKSASGWNSGTAVFNLMDDADSSTSGLGYYINPGSGQTNILVTSSYVDVAGSTTETTYGISFKGGSSNTMYIGSGDIMATIIVMEFEPPS